MNLKNATTAFTAAVLFASCYVAFLVVASPTPKPQTSPAQERRLGPDFAIERGTIYCTSPYDNHLYALRADTGEQVWAVPASGGSIETGPVVRDRRVFVAGGGAFQTVYALDSSDGHTLWSASVRASILAPGPDKLFANDQVPGTVVALDLTTGSPAWSSKVGTTSAYVGAIEYRSGTLYTDQGVVDASNGRKLWNWPNGFSVDRITFSGRYVIAATVSGQVGSFDAKSGLVHWQSRRPRNSKLGGGVAGQEGVFVVTYDDYQDEAHNGSLVALNRQDGSVRWRLPLLSKNQPLLSEPLALSGGKLYLLRPHKTGTGDDIVALDARTGHSLWTYPSGRGLTGPPVVQQGLIYVSAAGENWLALNENHGRPVWSFTPPGRQVAAPSERGRK